jgi:hypothetical protein
LPGEERRGEEIMEMIIIREWYKIMKARERERDREIEIERREEKGVESHEESANPETHCNVTSGSSSLLLSLLFFFHYFRNPLQRMEERG